jgi:hypothetical protein
LPLIDVAPDTVFPSATRPPVLLRRISDPLIVLPAHPSAGSPTITRPVDPSMSTEPLIVDPQIRTLAAPVALNGPLIVEFSMSTEAPACTSTAPLM